MSTDSQNFCGVYSYTNQNLRVQILSDGIIRIEESASGLFTDENTLIVNDRSSFKGTNVICKEDENNVILSTEELNVTFPKENPRSCDVCIFDKKGKTVYSYFENEKHGFYSELPSPSNTPLSFVLMDNGIIPAKDGLTYSGATDEASGWSRSDNTDIYVLVCLGDGVKLRRLFVELTGRTHMSNIKALGSWYSKWSNHSAKEKLEMIDRYRKENIPLDMIVIDTEWKNTSVGGNGGNGTGYVTNDELYPDMEGFLKAAKDAGVLVLFNDHTHQTPLKITNPQELKWQSEGICSLLKIGLDGWWYDRNWSFSIKSPYGDVLFSTVGQVLYNDTMAKYHEENKDSEYPARVLLLSNVDWIKHGHITGNPSVIGHRYGAQWTGDIYGDPLQLRREIENMVLGSANGASPYMSSDLGGFWHNDTVTRNHFIRWMQYGSLSPVTRVHSTLPGKNEHFPWSYDETAQKTIKDFINMRYHLMPYYYMLARENHDTGMPLMRRLDFYYPQYEESQDNSQYLIGKSILAAPFWSTEGDGQFAVPSEWLKTKDGEKGLYAEYFNIAKGVKEEAFFAGTPTHTEIVPNIDYYWYIGSPNKKIASDYFSARFSGTITPQTDCYIGTLADDGARIYIDGKLWSDGYASSQVYPHINNTDVLKAGKTYDIVIEYYELIGKAILYFVYEPVLGTNMSQRNVFIPDGTWINVFSGEKTIGPKTIAVTGDITQTPLFVKQGSVIPASKVISPLTSADWEELSANIYGLEESSFTLYEDDGKTKGYMDGRFRSTEISVKALTNDSWLVTIGASIGEYSTNYATRKVKLRIHSDVPLSASAKDGSDIDVSKIQQDRFALPFSDSGASAVSNIYEITVDALLTSNTSVILKYI